MGKLSAFISYRRQDKVWAVAIYQYLTQQGHDVFMDLEDLGGGTFERSLVDEINRRTNFLLVLSGQTLQRCVDPKDFLRIEIETALASQKHIVPIMLEGFTFEGQNASSVLVESIGRIASLNGLRLLAEYFIAAMTRLQERFLISDEKSVLLPLKPEERTTSRESFFNKVIENERDFSAEAWHWRGIAAAENDQKIKCFRMAIQEKPNFAHAYMDLGSALIVHSRYFEAVQAFDHALVFEPSLAICFMYRGQARSLMNDLTGAERDISIYLEINPTHHKALRMRAAIRVELGSHVLALEDAKQAVMNQPTDASGYYVLAKCLIAQGLEEEAVRELSKAREIDPLHQEVLELRSGIHLTNSRFEDALRDYDALLNINPKDWRYLLMRSQCLSALFKFAAAEADLTAAINLNSTEASLYAQRAKVRLSASRLDESAADYVAAIDYNSKIPEYYLGLGATYNHAGYNIESLCALMVGVSLFPCNRDLERRITMTQFSLELFDECILGCREYLNKQPHDGTIRHQLAKCLAAVGNFDDAVAECRNCSVDPRWARDCTALQYICNAADGRPESQEPDRAPHRSELLAAKDGSGFPSIDELLGEVLRFMRTSSPERVLDLLSRSDMGLTIAGSDLLQIALGDAHLMMGNISESEAAYLRAANINPMSALYGDHYFVRRQRDHNEPVRQRSKFFEASGAVGRAQSVLAKLDAVRGRKSSATTVAYSSILAIERSRSEPDRNQIISTSLLKDRHLFWALQVSADVRVFRASALARGELIYAVVAATSEEFPDVSDYIDQNSRLTLNIGAGAVSGFHIDASHMTFQASFGNKGVYLAIPVDRIVSLYSPGAIVGHYFAPNHLPDSPVARRTRMLENSLQSDN